MFEKASRKKLRFAYRGICTVEDLWDLPVEALDTIYKGMNAQVKMAQEESLLDARSKESETLELGVEIVKYVVGIKLTEQEARKDAALRYARKQKLMEVLDGKQDAALQDLSEEELQAMIGELD